MNGEKPAITGLSRNSTLQIVRLLQDVSARIVYLREALEDGDAGLAYAIAVDLEQDVVAELVRVKQLEEAA